MTDVLMNARVLADDGWHDDLAVVVEGGRIRQLSYTPDVGAAAQYDLSGRMLLPGFIDCQVNGGGGVLFNNAPTVDGIRAIGAAHRRFGTTAFLPTLISDTIDKMRTAVAAADAAIAASVPGVLGIHLEGPFISEACKGCHDSKFLHSPDRAELAVAESLRHGVTLMTIAPECVSADTIASIVASGVIVSAGHSDADYATVRAALDAGVRGFTHLYNAMSQLVNRAPGMVGAALDDANTWCGVIVDGRHVSPASLRVALKAKPRGKLMLVTDAMPPVGGSEPSFVLDGGTITVRDGVCWNADGVLAGSALSMIDAVRNAVQMLEIPLEEAVRMATAYPAEFLGRSTTLGHIAEGYVANFTIVDADLRVTETWVDGQQESY